MNHSIIERRRNLDKITDFHLPICGNRLDLRVERGRFKSQINLPSCSQYFIQTINQKHKQLKELDFSICFFFFLIYLNIFVFISYPLLLFE